MTHVAARAAVGDVAPEVYAASTAGAVARDALESTRTGSTPARRVLGSAADLGASAAIVHVGIGVGARAIAVRGSAGTIGLTRSTLAHFAQSARVTTTAAIERIVSEVDAAPRAFHGPFTADPLAGARTAAHGAPERRRAGIVARAAVIDALFGIHARAIALEKSRIARDAAAIVTHGLGVRGRRTRLFAATAMLRIGLRVDADARAVELPRRTFALASSVGADLALRTPIVAGPTMLGVSRQVDTRTAALRVARHTHAGAGAVRADGLAIGWRVAGMVAITAVVGVAFEVPTRAVTQREARGATELASARAARRSSLPRWGALGTALPAVEHAGVQVDAGARTVARTGGASRCTSPLGTHLARRTRLRAGAAVPRIAREIDAAFRALRQASVAGRLAFAGNAFCTRPCRAVTTHGARAAVRGVRREIDTATTAQSQRGFTQPHAATVDTALLRSRFARACRMAAPAVVGVVAEFDTLVATDRLALRARGGHEWLVRLARREAQPGRDIARIAVDAAAFVVTSEPVQIATDVARAGTDERDAERER